MTASPGESAELPPRELTAGDIESIAVDVWAAYLPSIQRPLSATPVPLRQGTDVLRATVSVEGAWNGRITVLLEQVTAAEVAEAMLGAPPEAPEDVADAIGELVNVVGGNVKSLMPSPSALSLPRVGQGPSTALAEPQTTRSWAVDLAWGDRPLRIAVDQTSRPGQHRQPAQSAMRGAR
jgi:chemotaxis protein CheX